MAKILVVDDAPFIRELVRTILEKHGHQIVGEAVDGQHGVEQALKLRPDVILMDLIMPRKSGIEATREIMQSWPEARIIAVSTADHDSILSKAIDAGCRNFVGKPFEPQDLLSAIEKNVGE
jgi:two-component system, chemotaxis family, chemotaxis protein CheY